MMKLSELCSKLGRPWSSGRQSLPYSPGVRLERALWHCYGPPPGSSDETTSAERGFCVAFRKSKIEDDLPATDEGWTIQPCEKHASEFPPTT
jgi:hypothetical protein